MPEIIKIEGFFLYDKKYNFVFDDLDGDLSKESKRLWLELYPSILKFPNLKGIVTKLHSQKNIKAIVCYLRVFQKYLIMIPEWGACKPWQKKDFPLLDYTNEDLTQEDLISVDDNTCLHTDDIFIINSLLSRGRTIHQISARLKIQETLIQKYIETKKKTKRFPQVIVV